jgi:hypothetical protein
MHKFTFKFMSALSKNLALQERPKFPLQTSNWQQKPTQLLFNVTVPAISLSSAIHSGEHPRWKRMFRPKIPMQPRAGRRS